MDCKDLIHLITHLASEREAKLTTLRLVKFLYLADLYMARETGGDTITKWPWAFVHFGPFCRESLQEIQKCVTLGIIESESKSSQVEETDYQLFWCSDQGDLAIDNQLPIYVSSSLRSAIKKWCEDSSGLMDYVYFETEPMVEVKKGEALNFSLASKPAKNIPINMMKLSKSQLIIGKRAVANLVEKLRKSTNILPESNLVMDIEFDKWLRSLGEEDLPAGLTGRAKLNL